MQYQIIKAEDFSPLAMRVNDAIREGWQPLNAPFQSGSSVYQAMTKDALDAPCLETGAPDALEAGTSETAALWTAKAIHQEIARQIANAVPKGAKRASSADPKKSEDANAGQQQ
ncbi:DUF1737 domain-containing protein [Comamonadaceae bacterium OH3737_COT-264]|nr:DUF1737 domain-containing protein [Comamonadaceae bacterium OH3737_COT-264]